MTYTIKFPCGAAYRGAKDDPRKVTSNTRKDGAIRLCIYDSQAEPGELQRPTLADEEGQSEGEIPNCRFGCPKKRASGRRETRCFPKDEHPERRDEHGMMRWRYVITCYGAVTVEVADGSRD